MTESFPLGVGSVAPDFTVPAGDGRAYTLSELLSRGHIALFFYPGNNTPG